MGILAVEIQKALQSAAVLHPPRQLLIGWRWYSATSATLLDAMCNPRGVKVINIAHVALNRALKQQLSPLFFTQSFVAIATDAWRILEVFGSLCESRMTLQQASATSSLLALSHSVWRQGIWGKWKR